ncbi:MAG: ABC transporter ATP-binding protein [Spirochaetaceae bacterium]|nr:ABC transporter ATP-binding protein [Spirochaetaceae bacterium]
MSKDLILEINNFSLSFIINKQEINAVNDVSLKVEKGEIVGLVGESGCGKSLTALSIVNLAPQNSFVVQGEIKIHDENVLKFTSKQWNERRGNDFSIIFQEPMTALDPLVKIGNQIKQTIVIHNKEFKKDKIKLKQMIIDMLISVQLKDPELIYNSYPHQLSGGMRQRVLIALALINNPCLLVADEATTALDVSVQKQVLNILSTMNKDRNLSILFISHDLGIVKNFCDRIYVMYAGAIVESGKANDLIENPIHPYTKGLISSIPSFSKRGSTLSTIKGNVPTLLKRTNTGCPFVERCLISKKICLSEKVPQQNYNNRSLYCHLIDLEKSIKEKYDE